MFDSRVRYRWLAAAVIALLVCGAATQAATPVPASTLKIDLMDVADGFEAPVYMTHAGDGTERLFVVEKGGRIMILQNGKIAGTPFLDITPLVNSASSERGLLSVAFHPQYKQNGLFYVYYTAQPGDVTIARYHVSSDPNVADPNSAKILLSVEHQTYPNHNGGLLLFGPDGFLYAGLGDGGSGGDPNGNGQNTKVLLGKLLRLDVDHGDPYGIPADNPFADGKAGRPEVWAYGLRNPWRYSFDQATGDLYIGDVGQNAWEEVDIQRAKTPGGVNYGWNRMEGLHCYSPSEGCDQNGLTLPVAEYDHSQGCAIIGGYVYHGTKYPRLVGTYFFADECSGRIWAMQESSPDKWQTTEVLQVKNAISSFGVDAAGELYVTDLSGGSLLQVVDKSQ